MPPENLLSDVNTDLLQLADEAFADLATAFPEGELTRMRGFFDNISRRTEPLFHAHQSTNVPPLHFPGLPYEPFYDTRLFPEAAELADAYEIVRAEAARMLDGSVRPAPYESKDQPEWPKWKKLVFYDGGPHGRQEANCQACPNTSALVDRIVSRYDDFLSAGFLVHDGRMTIAPHIDWFNLYISLWLPIFVPADCGLEVGGQRRLLEAGRCIAFDNSFVHSSWNNSDERRIVLAIYRLTPRLTPTESRAFVRLKRTYGQRLFQPAGSRAPHASEPGAV